MKRSRVFSAAGMRIHFSYPASLRPTGLIYRGRSAGGGAKIVTAVGSPTNNEDLILVSLNRFSPFATTSKTKQALDRVISQLARRPISGTVRSVRGLVLVSYPRIPVPQLADVTSRVTFVIAGRQEYELQCQATGADLHTIEAACNEATATVSVR